MFQYWFAVRHINSATGFKQTALLVMNSVSGGKGTKLSRDQVTYPIGSVVISTGAWMWIVGDVENLY